MPWVKLDDGFSEHPKLEKAGPLAGWMHVCALCYCARNLTDGRIPKSKAHRLADVPKPAQLAARLVEVGLWEVDGDDYVIHDYGDYNPSRAQVEAERSAAAERQRKARESRRDRSRDNGRSPEPSHADTSDVTHGVSSAAPYPSPYPLAVTGQSVTSTASSDEPDDDDPIRRTLAGLAKALGQGDHDRRVAEVVGDPLRDPGAHLRKCIRRRLDDPELEDLVRRHPDRTVEQLVALQAGPQTALAADPDGPPPGHDCPICGGSNLVEVGPNEHRICDHVPLEEAS